MASIHPKEIVTLAGGRFKVDAVHYEYAKGVFRVSWFDGRPKGGLAEKAGEEFREIEKQTVGAR